jgi:CHAT domain-containing protein
LFWPGGDGAAARRILADAIAAIESLRISTPSEEIKIDLLGTVQQAYESAVLAHVDSQDYATAFGYVERARARAFLDLLARRDAELAAQLAQQPVSLTDVQAHLAPATLLLEYFSIGTQAAGDLLLDRIPETNQRLREKLSTPPEILLFAIASDRMEVHRIKLDPNRLQPQPDDPMPGRHLLGERRLARLYQLLIQPVEHLIAGRQLLYIIPHGPLHYLSFAALQAPNGTAVLSPGGPALAYAPSATVLQACLARPAGRGSAKLALGYNSAGVRALRFAEHEAQQIALMLGGAALHGPAPKTAALLEGAPRLRQLHIGGHAVFRPSDPLGSYLLLGLDDHIDARSLLRDLKLSADLVTLNACTSGLSSVVPGDELLGLPRALLSAGAATVVCTLAEVDDLAAYLLMIMFYRNLALGRTPAGALHAAQNALRALSRAEVQAIFEQERANGAPIEPPPLESYGEQPFADPGYWAPVLLIGRP